MATKMTPEELTDAAKLLEEDRLIKPDFHSMGHIEKSRELLRKSQLPRSKYDRDQRTQEQLREAAEATRNRVRKGVIDYDLAEGSGQKKGGIVKKMAKGGKVSSASRRGDGIAQRGKTKGRMV